MLTINRRSHARSSAYCTAGKIRYFPPTHDYATGYGRISLALIEAFRTVEVGTTDEIDLALTWPGIKLSARLRFTMWEPDAIPKPLTLFLNDGALIVPCESNRQVFAESGFNRNIHVIPLWGEAEFTPMPDDSTLRFICVAKDNGVRSRKGVDDLIECFKDAFPHERDVALTIKNSPECFYRTTDDCRITVIRSNLPFSDYNKLISDHHCGIFLSGLEAWNFPACELMAAGRPSILVPYGGPTSFSTPETSWHLDYKMSRSPDCHPYYGVGRGAAPTRDSIIAAMRECYSNRGMLKKKAEASRAASVNFTREKFVERMRVVMMNEIGMF